jgi:hypothetical protein
MVQALGILPDVNDRSPNHVLAGRMQRHCLHPEFNDEKKAASRKRGQPTDSIRGTSSWGEPLVSGSPWERLKANAPQGSGSSAG